LGAKTRYHRDPREVALNLLYRVEHKGAYANLAVDRELDRYEDNGSQHALVTELVNGTVRMRKHLDWVLNLFLSKPIQKQNPWLREILRMSVYQLLFMDNVPEYAVVNEAVGLAGRKLDRGLSAVVNGVLRNVIRNRGEIPYPDMYQNPVEYLSVYYSHPEWMVARWVERYGLKGACQLLEHNNVRPRVALRTNLLKVDREELFRSLTDEGCRCTLSCLTPWGVWVEETGKPLRKLHSYREGWFYVQDDASMLVSAACAPEAGQVVYDLAAGVGGKTSHLAELMGNQGIIRAVEILPKKVEILKENIRRLGITIVDIWTGDALGPLAPGWGEGDVVLLDAPCSGLGVLRRRSDARWRKSEKDITVLSELQKRLLKRGAQLVRPGGVLVYSTCTLEPEENEEVIDWFLGEETGFVLDDLSQPLRFFPFSPEDAKAASRGMLVLFPPRYGTDGMFIARLRRTR